MNASTANWDIRAVSLDLDDTLWPVMPALERAEQQLDAWLGTHYPEVAQRYPIAAMRTLREDVAADRPDIAHDFGAQRHESLVRAFAACEVADARIDEAFDIYFTERNGVELYTDALEALQRLQRQRPLISISNGNADLRLIGLDHLFAASFSARECGALKPDARIFADACAHLQLAPEQILHVGDDPLCDVVGAREAGLRTAWMNRERLRWNEDMPAADLELHDLEQLAAWLERHVAA